MSEQVQKNFIRRKAKRLGLDLKKSKGKKWSIINQMGWQIIDSRQNLVLQGEQYQLSLEEVENFLNQYEQQIR